MVADAEQYAKEKKKELLCLMILFRKLIQLYIKDGIIVLIHMFFLIENLSFYFCAIDF